MAVVVRPAAPADLERVLAIARRSSTPAQWPEKEYKKVLAPEPENGQSRLALVIGTEQKAQQAQQGQQVQGFIIGRLAGGQWEIENIAVDRDAQRQGLGRQLLRAFLDRARQRGTAVFLEVRESNIPARRLYEGMGFVQTGRRKSYYRAPEEDAVVLKFSF
jgi:[ribosomal protein S18]-alanine N-acetyltransferase